MSAVVSRLSTVVRRCSAISFPKCPATFRNWPATFPKFAGTFPNCPGMFPNCPGTFPKCARIFPYCAESFPNSTASFPKSPPRPCASPRDGAEREPAVTDRPAPWPEGPAFIGLPLRGGAGCARGASTDPPKGLDLIVSPPMGKSSIEWTGLNPPKGLDLGASFLALPWRRLARRRRHDRGDGGLLVAQVTGLLLFLLLLGRRGGLSVAHDSSRWNEGPPDLAAGG